MSGNRRAIPAAAGYPQYSGNLIHPVVTQELIERFYCSTIFGEISTTNYLGQLNAGGDQITFWREPCVIVRDHIKDGSIVHDTLESAPITLVIDKAKEFSLKIARVDEKMMQMWDTFKNSFLKGASRELAKQIDCEILGTVYADVDCRNSGGNAGCVSQSYNLGQPGNPVVVTPGNIIQVLSDLHGTLNEACIPREGRWIVLPSVFEVALINSPLQNAYVTGMSMSPMLNGKLPTQIMGFDVYISDNVSRVFDAGTGTWAYNILCGTKAGIVFASTLNDTRTIEDANSWDRYFQGLQVFGYDVIQPSALAHLYARVA